MTQPAIPRDAAYIEARSIPEPNSGCWLWVHAVCPAGYGKVLFRGKVSSASRVSFIIHKGDVEPGNEVDHLCFVPSCVNPDHLRSVTRVENIRHKRPGGGKPRPRAGDTCRNGHVYLVAPRYKAGCRECARAAERRYKHKVRAAIRCAPVSVSEVA